jgi:hypothetical protein
LPVVFSVVDQQYAHHPSSSAHLLPRSEDPTNAR